MAQIHMIDMNLWINIMWIHMILWSHIYNDVGAFSSDWDHQVKLLASILCWLCKNGFTIGPLTRPLEKLTGLDNGLRHNIYTLEKKNIDAILHMDWPFNATELCMFIGYVNYYCTCCRVALISLNRIDLWFDNLLYGQTKYRKHLYNAFAYGYKSIACPDHNKWFSIHTNASDFQLGTCIIQEEGRLPSSLAIWQCHSKAILHWNSKYFPS